MAHRERVVSAEDHGRPSTDTGVGRIAPRRPWGPRGVARATLLAAIILGGCQRSRDTGTAPARTPITRLDAPASHAPTTPSTPPEQRTERWSRAYSNAPIGADALRALLAEAAQTDGDSAALTIGRRAALTDLDAIAGTLPGQRLDPFLRGLARRPLGAITLPTPWKLRWMQEPPSVALGTLLGESGLVLDPLEAAQAETLLLDGDLTHQTAGARSIQNSTIPVPAVASLVALHPVVFPLAMRSLALRGGVPGSTWLSLIATVGARVHPNPRSWGGAWISLMDTVPTTDATIRGALLGLEPIVTQVQLRPASVLAAYRCAVALRFDRLDQGQRTEVCASGPDAWRSLAALAERARPPQSAPVLAEQLRNVLVRGSNDPRVVEPVAQAIVLLPVYTARPIILQLAENRDPGVLAALLEALHAHLPHARALPAPVLDRLLRAPFDLPEAPSLEARLHAIELRRALGLPPIEVPTTVRALRHAAQPDAAPSPQSAVVAPASSAGIWVLETTAGTIRIALRGDTATEALRLLLETSRAGTYRHTTFHRVVPGFVAQGGDPRGDGYGGTSRIVPTELSGGRFERGAVGIPLSGLDTGGAQFFIILTDSPHLDARYPYLGRVVAGMDVADRLMRADEIVSDGIIASDAGASEP